MIHAMIGKKKGMTQVFSEDGSCVPVTVIEAELCKVVQVKTDESDGYSALQIGFSQTTEKRAGKPRAGHLKKAGLEPMRRLMEIRLDSVEGYEMGQAIKMEDIFVEGESVDVRGTSKGRGFAGTIKRHNFQRGDVTHGGMAVRRPGAIGQCASPSRVFKGKRMAGHMGNRKLTVRNLKIVRVDPENGYLLVRGAVPGPVNGEIVISKTKKGVRVPKYKTG
ncbi:MAG: 50S ribosomal protein L3 [Gemmatimonadota bacterium]|nr:MAG: 50S ribosomal protein L3 [Gemmatimonadota bacterium]